MPDALTELGNAGIRHRRFVDLDDVELVDETLCRDQMMLFCKHPILNSAQHWLSKLASSSA